MKIAPPPGAPEAPLLADLAGKYLTFFLDRETYGVPVIKVREIISMLPITQVPQVPAYMKGVINLRGKVIPVIDLRAKLFIAQAKESQSTCIVVVQINGTDNQIKLIGLIVDDVEEVANIAMSDIVPAPDFGGSISARYIFGMAKTKGAVKILIDIDQIIAADTIERITTDNAA